ncbi:MAG: hypothetical protein R3F58_10000 [Steroidobacteraceae bacterium]
MKRYGTPTLTVAAGLAIVLGGSLTANAKDRAAPKVPPTTLKIVEQSFEATTSQVVLPSGAVGILVVTPCVGCTPVSLTSSGSTQWLVGQEPVSLASFRQHLTKSPRAQLGVFFFKDRSELSRVIATVN